MGNPGLNGQLAETPPGRTPIVPSPAMIMAFMRDLGSEWAPLARPGSDSFTLCKLKNVLNFWDTAAFDSMKRTTSLAEFYAALDTYLAGSPAEIA
ncbi:MAG: hypothetical protein H7338_13075 [Candidatus Sericytochromatia bacterium]|nr:hypothetical protein [Candidatus Sericytochromatia bacterium]